MIEKFFAAAWLAILASAIVALIYCFPPVQAILLLYLIVFGVVGLALVICLVTLWCIEVLRS